MMAFGTTAARRPYLCRRLGVCAMLSSSPSSSSSSSPPSTPPAGGGAPDEWRDSQRVLSFAREGPIFPKSFAPNKAALPEGGEWVDKGLFLRQQLGLSPTAALASDAGIRIFHLYLPVYFWLRWLLLRRGPTDGGGRRPCRIVGINAPQGAGKTTLVNSFRDLFRRDGLSSVVLSIDDLYLTFQAQQELARQHPGNRLLEFRGNAGTHDVELGRATLLKCLQAGAGDTVRVPCYDKALHGGRGDRAPEEQWAAVEGPIDVVLLEGWMLGFRPLPPDSPALQQAGAGGEGLGDVNAYLGQYARWHELVDAWVVVQVEDVEQVYAWRLEAERRMRARRGQGAGLTDEQVADFVSRFLPAYRAFLAPSLYGGGGEREGKEGEEGGGDGIDGKPTLRFRIDAQRRPTP